MARVLGIFLGLLGLTAGLFWMSKLPTSSTGEAQSLTASTTPSTGTDTAASTDGASSAGEPATQPASTTTNTELAAAASTQSAGEQQAQAIMPLFDTVAVDAKGAARISGKAEPGAEVTLLMNDKPSGVQTAGADGVWTFNVDVPVKDTQSTLAISVREPKGTTQIVPDRVRIDPPAKSGDAPKATLVAQDGTSKVLQETGVQAQTGLIVEKAETASAGKIVLAGRGDPGMTVRVLIGGEKLGEAIVDPLGRWNMDVTSARTGNLRLELLDTAGATKDRVDLPFTVAAADGATGATADTAKAEADAKAKAEADEKAKAEADAKAKTEADEKAKAEADAKAKAEADEKAKAEADAKAKAEADEKAKAEADAKAKAEADEKAKAEADAKAKAVEDAAKAATKDAAASVGTAGDPSASIANSLSAAVEAVTKATEDTAKANAPPAAKTVVKRTPKKTAVAKDTTVRAKVASAKPTRKAATHQATKRKLAMRKAAHRAAKAQTVYKLVPVTSTQIVTVRRGQSLWGIAQKYYGDGDAWTRIERKNARAIRDPDLIQPGTQLKVHSTTMRKVAVQVKKHHKITPPKKKRKAPAAKRARAYR